MAEGPRDRAVAPTAGKLFEVGLVVLYVGLVAATLYGGAVPGYRSAAGDAVAERTLAAATQEVQQAVPPNGTSVEAAGRVELTDTIRNRPYAVRVDSRALVVDHPHPEVTARARLALPSSVVAVRGNWSSAAPAWVVVEGTPRGTVVRLEEGQP